MQRRHATTLEIYDAGRLRQVRDMRYHVPTPAEARLVTVAGGMADGSVALSGPRGVGKTDLLNAFCRGRCGVPVGLSVVVPAPVAYDKREFMLYLFASLCERVKLLDSKPMRVQAERHLEWIRYLQIVSAEVTTALPCVF